MDYAELKNALANPATIKQSSFSLLREIACRVNQRITHDEGRDLVIRALAMRQLFSPSEQEILFSLVRSVGLFPYMTGHLDSSDFDDLLAYELHRAESMDGEIVFHSLQAKIYYQLLSGANVILSASTSVGKSLIIDAVIASGKHRKIVVIVPTLALIDETRRRLTRRFRNTCAIITHPSQRAHEEHLNIYILTQERVLHRDDLDDVDFFVLDEFYKLSLESEKESDRAIDLNLAFHKLARTGAQFYMLGPNIQSIKGLEKFEYHFIPSEFSTVAVDVVNLNLPTRGEERINRLADLCQSIDGPTIVYCQSPRSASEVAEYLADNAGFESSKETAAAVDWIADNYHPDWVLCKALQKGIGVHHGGIPRALQQYFIRLFNERRIRFLVCTSTIIEGVNTVAKNVIVYDRRKSKDVLDHFTYKNIEGRAGRMGEYFVGRVYVLETPPPDESYAVEVPLGHQKSDTPLGLLLQLDAEDLVAQSRERLDDLFKKSTLSPETLRKNRYTPPYMQEQIAATIRADLERYEVALIWSGVPRGHQLEAVCELIFRYLEATVLPDYGIHSGASLAWHLNELQYGQGITAYIKRCVADRSPDLTPSGAVERALRFIRNVVCQRFPRDLMVLSAIQSEIFLKTGRDEAGDYSLYAELAENLFLPSQLFALDEYGVPVQTAQRLAVQLLPATGLDNVLRKLRRLPISRLELTIFEREVLEDVQRNI